MPRPSRINCAILRLSCAVTALMLPTAAKAQVTINSAYQYAFNSVHYGERPFGHVWREQRSEWEDLDLFHTSTVSPGLRGIITTTKYRSTLVTGPTSRGTVFMAQRFDPGLVLLRDLNKASLSLWAQSSMSITFSNTLVAQVQLRATTCIDSPEAFYAACGIRIFPANQPINHEPARLPLGAGWTNSTTPYLSITRPHHHPPTGLVGHVHLHKHHRPRRKPREPRLSRHHQPRHVLRHHPSPSPPPPPRGTRLLRRRSPKASIRLMNNASTSPMKRASIQSVPIQ